MIIRLSAFLVFVFLGACAGAPQVSTVQALSESADAPYANILVVSLFKDFDARRYFEKEIVRQLSERGIDAVASTSLMDTRTPVTRQTFLAMVENLESDAVLVTRLVSTETKATMKDMRPKASYNVRPTYYWNVWSVEQTEYVEPQRLELKYDIVLATQLYSARYREAVWAIESQTKIVQAYDKRGDFSVVTSEAKAITSHMLRDGLIARR